MDSGRFVLQPPGWDNSSALEGYEVYHDRNLRNVGAFGGPFRDEDGYGRMPYTREPVYERDAYPAGSNVVGHWPHINRHSIDDGISIREAQRQEHENVYRDYGVSKPDRWELDGVDNDYEYRHGLSHGSREGSRDLDYDYSRHEYESDKGNDRRERDWSRRHGRSKSRDWSSDRERHASPDRERHSEHSHSLGNDGHSRRSRSPRGRSKLSREDSHEESHQTTRGEKRSDRDRERDRDRDYRGSRARERDFEEHDAIYGHEEAVPSATLVVKGLSPKTLEDDLYQALAEWGPLKHVRVIKERNSGASRGFAFIDFPSIEAAKKMMEDLGPDGLVISGRRLCFEYSSKPTGGGASQSGDGGFARLNMRGNNVAPADWMCIVCGCVNFARRTLCFQCNESRTDDAPAADVFNSSAAASGRKGIESAPTHVLVVRGLEESVDEETLHYEFSKYAPIKDLRLIRDKFTHVSRGFAFVHFNSVEDATRALAKSNGTALEKNGQVLKVAFAKSVHGPGSSGGLSSQSSSLAAAAIEAATFAQQYDSGGYASKDSTFDKSKPKLKTLAGAGVGAGAGESNHNAVSQSGFVWDEASGYYYSASTGFYYDGHRGLYYDGNSGVWYSYNQETQQYVPYTNQSAVSTENPSATKAETSKLESDGQVRVPEVTQSKDDMTATNADSVSERKPSLAEAVAAAAAAAQTAAKKEKEKMKEREKDMRLALKKKMNNVLTLWKQRQLTGSAVPEGHAEDHNIRRSATLDSGNRAPPFNPQSRLNDIFDAKESSGMTDTTAVKIPDGASDNLSGQIVTDAGMSKGAKVVVKVSETPTATVAIPFKTDASALGSYGPTAGTKRRFSETPQPVYRDRAAERRSLYGSSLTGESTSGYELDDKGRDIPFPPGVMGRGSRGLDMPFPPGVGPKSDSEVPVAHDLQSYEVITSEKAIDESNVGNRMLRNMGWQEGTGLGKGGTGIVEPVQPQGGNERAGLGCQTQRKIDARFETQPGDSYRIVIQKKALARFHEMM